MRDKIFFIFCFGFIFGIFFRSFIFLNQLIIILFGLILLAVMLFSIFLSFDVKSNFNRWKILGLIFLGAIILGGWRFHLVDNQKKEFFAEKIGQLVQFSGIIIDEPDIRISNQKLTVKVKEEQQLTKILISTNLEQSFNYGDQINFLGRLTQPENFLTEQGKEFDYFHYLKKDGIEYLINNPKIQKVSAGSGNKLISVLLKVKEKFLAIINQTIPAPENLLLGGLILGERSAFSIELRENFIRTGTIHLIALSGYNVTIVAEWIMKLFSFLPKNFGILSGIFAIIFFVLMTGGKATAVRAGIMALLVLIARATGRTYDVGRALILAGILMLIFNPYLLIYDVSFQLSFLATIGVIFFTPKIEKYFFWVPKNFGFRDILSVTTAVYFFVLPFILYTMGNLSLVAIFANILVLPFIPLTMAFGFFTGLTGILWYFLSVPFGQISYFLLSYQLGIINWLAEFSFASISISYFPLWLTILIYGYFFYYIFGLDIKKFFTKLN